MVLDHGVVFNRLHISLCYIVNQPLPKNSAGRLLTKRGGCYLLTSSSSFMKFLSVFVTTISLMFLVFSPHLRTFVDTTTSLSYDQTNEKDYLALMGFKSKIVDDPNGLMESWNGSNNFCRWPGITCGRRHRRVTGIRLPDSGLVGSLSPFLGNLSFLRELNLYNNTFQGRIPPEYGRLSRLRRLILRSNYLVGQIPGNLSQCSNLVYLSVSENNLTGKIPGELGSLSKLGSLSIHVNKLTGRIPDSIGNLTSLRNLSLAQNLLVGEIPESLGQLNDLERIGCAENQLFGLVPLSIYNISSLVVLSIPENQLHGCLPPKFGLMLPRLQMLQLRDNHFAGPLPTSLSNASALEIIELSNNRFSGKIATDFGGMQNLTYVILASNNFGSEELDEMTFLSSMANCSNLYRLNLETNQLKGMLPEGIGNLSSQLKFLLLGENHMYGSMPSTIGRLTSLNYLALPNNRLRGKIPGSVGSLQNLQGLDLSDNMFFGEIPESLGNLTILNILFLDRNQLEGAIPSGLGNCRNLLSLSLSQNNLSDAIPKEIFGISTLGIRLDLSQNHLIGSIPVEIGELVNLSELDLSENNLSGEIPKTIGKCTSLVNLSLARNIFNGLLPSSFSSFRGIQIINVSHNNLSGQIPLFLQNFTLHILDLSVNDLEGEVPTQGIFKNASATSVAGNRRLCGGIAEFQLSNCHINESKKHKISSAVIISIVVVACLSIGVVWLLYFFICSSKRSDLLSTSLSMRSHLKVSYRKLFKATNGFSSENLIGAGSFGSVYKGTFDDDNGFIIAVKVINLLHRGALKSFMHECEVLRNIRHRNLLKIITCCSGIDSQGNDFKALVYEFMPNGSLENWLHLSIQTGEPNARRKLDLFQRINIAIDVACALDYLQHHCERQIIHCDIKPSNILLDSDMTAHVGDFGLAEFLPIHTIVCDSSSIGVRGSIGYVAPEYGLGTDVSPSGDIYSYGILLLEMMTGKRPTGPMFVEGFNLHKFVSMAMPNHVMNIVDPILLMANEAKTTNRGSPLEVTNRSKIEDCLISIFQVGLACSVDSPQDRMDMGDVVARLQSIRNNMLHNRSTR